MNGADPAAPQRVLFFGFRRPLNQQALRCALDARRPAHVCLVSRSNFLGSLADEFVSARNGFRGCGFETNEFRSFPSAEFLRAMRPCEVVALRMYERIFRGAHSGLGHRRRKNLYLQHVCYAYGLLVDGAYEELVFSEIPHHPFAYILHSVALELGLRSRFFAQIQVKDSWVIAGRIDELFDEITAEHARLRSAGPVVGDEPLAGRMRVEVERRTTDHRPFYMGVSDLTWSKKIYQRSKRFFRADDRLRVHRTLRNGLAYLRARRPVPPVGERFVYFPLHLQPEATTSPMGGVFTDQYLALETLVRALPRGWKVVVKENPAQRFAKRDYGFYEQLARTPQIHLIDRAVSTFELIERCEAVATITGTAGWEALFKGKPAIVFGHAFYRSAPGAIAVEEVESLAAALEAIDSGCSPAWSVDDLRRFLLAVQRSSLHGVVDAAYLRDSDLPFEVSVQRYCRALTAILEGRDPLEDASAPE